MKKNRFKFRGLCIALTALCLLPLTACSAKLSVNNTQATEAGTAVTESAEKTEQKFDADAYYEKLESCAEQIRQKTDFVPDVVLVLGSGLGNYADNLDIVTTIPYSEIDGWPESTVEGHEGNLSFANYRGLKVAVMQGRIHYYEGYDINDVVLPLRVLHLLGANTVILTNAVGAINTDYEVGDFVCVEDHISSFVPSPLVGENIDELGERFTGMTAVYDKELRNMVLEISKEKNITVHSGVLIQTTGPQFETPAEIRMYRTLGADTVGMSTVVEAIAAAHMGMRVCDINCVTNMAAGITGKQITNEEVTAAADKSEKDFTTLISALLDKIAEK